MPLPADLQPFVTEDLKADPVAWPVLEKMTEKDAASVLKSYGHAQHRLGRAVILPGKPEEAEAWRKENLPRLYQAGALSPPPSKPEEYEIAKPADLPEGLTWNDEAAKELGTILHKHGVSKAAVADLLSLHTKMLVGQHNGLKTSLEAAEAALKQEHGDKYDERYEAASRLAAQLFKTEGEVAFYEQLGIANDPRFLGPIMRLAPLAMQDTSFIRDLNRPSGGASAEEVRAEVAKIMTDKTHAMYAGYHARDPKVMAHIDALYKKLPGADEKVVIGGVVTERRPGT